jgi:hypothetical protein
MGLRRLSITRELGTPWLAILAVGRGVTPTMRKTIVIARPRSSTNESAVNVARTPMLNRECGMAFRIAFTVWPYVRCETEARLPRRTRLAHCTLPHECHARILARPHAGRCESLSPGPADVWLWEAPGRTLRPPRYRARVTRALFADHTGYVTTSGPA